MFAPFSFSTEGKHSRERLITSAKSKGQASTRRQHSVTSTAKRYPTLDSIPPANGNEVVVSPWERFTEILK